MVTSSLAEKRSPLIQCRMATADAWFTLEETAFAGHINIRADAGDTTLMDRLGGVLGLRLPLVANTIEAAGKVTALWLSPDEWLVIEASDDAAAARVEDIMQTLADEHVAATDVSSGQTILMLRGLHVREALARGCPLDLHPRSLKPGECAQTLLNHVNVTLWPGAVWPGGAELKNDAGVGEEQVNVVVRRSFADYLFRWLADVQSRV